MFKNWRELFVAKKMNHGEKGITMYLDGKIQSIGALPQSLSSYSGAQVRVAISKGILVNQEEVSFLCVVPEKDGGPEKRLRVPSDCLVFEDSKSSSAFTRALAEAERRALEKEPQSSASFAGRRYPHNGPERV